MIITTTVLYLIKSYAVHHATGVVAKATLPALQHVGHTVAAPALAKGNGVIHITDKALSFVVPCSDALEKVEKEQNIQQMLLFMQ